MFWHFRANTAGTVRNFACITALLIAVWSPRPAPSATSSAAEASEPIPVELYTAPVPKRIAAPSCAGSGGRLDSELCESLREGADGWARLNFMVDPAGNPFEVTVTRSTGNRRLDQAAEKAIEHSTFLPGSLNGKPIESGLELKFTFRNGQAEARPAFVAAYKSLTEAAKANDRAAADAAMKKLQITNLYEDAYFGMATFLYEKQWGSEERQLDGLSRAIAQEDQAHYLPTGALETALQWSWKLQVRLKLYAEALDTIKKLEKIERDAKVVAQLKSLVDTLERLRADDSRYEVGGEMPEGSWNIHLFKRHFQAQVSEGFISQVKLRCQKQYVYFAFDPSIQYQVASKSGECSMELIGAPGTRFKLSQF